jgi:hypothetical protein|uniref:Uncharacterized protein n=1 Tax=viral metagenome TaxID=1070528 RepID=A0A6C0DUR0_9ZZZZ
MEILEIDRKFTILSLENDVLVFEDISETFFIDKKYKDNLPSCCSVYGINENPDKEPVTLEYVLGFVGQCRPIDPNYVSDTEKHIFECTMTIKHNIKVSDSKGPIQSYTSDMVEKHYFEASLGDLEKYKYSDLQKLKDIHIIHNAKDKEILTLEKCIKYPKVIDHSGELSELPNLWSICTATSTNLDSTPTTNPAKLSKPASNPIINPVSNTKEKEKETEKEKEKDKEPVLLLEGFTKEQTANVKDFADNLRDGRGIRRRESLQEEVKHLKNILKNVSVSEHESPKEPENVVINFKQAAAPFSKTYNFEESLHSFTLDIICVYLKGQKLLYIEAKVYCEQYLYALMLPAIMITAMCSVISIALNAYTFGGIIVSCFTAINSFILSLITYLKLDAKAEAHKMTAYSFEKLQSVCEFSSGRILFSDPKLKLLEIMDDIGNQVKDIKEKNQFILPEAIRHKFPILYSTNVFSEVKRIQTREIILMNRMNNLINEGKVLQKRIDEKNAVEENTMNLNSIIADQDNIFVELIQHRRRYIDIDNDFKGEIEANIKKSERYRNNWCQWLKN